MSLAELIRHQDEYQPAIEWVSMTAPDADPYPRFRLLTSRVDFDFYPDDGPSGTLVSTDEDPEVL